MGLDQVRWRPSTGTTRTRGRPSGQSLPSIGTGMRPPGVGQVGGPGLLPPGILGQPDEDWDLRADPEILEEIIERNKLYQGAGNEYPGVTDPMGMITPAMRIHPDDLNSSGEVNVTDFILAGQRHAAGELPKESGLDIPGSYPDKTRSDPRTWGWGELPNVYPVGGFGGHEKRKIKKFEKMSKNIREMVDENPDWVPGVRQREYLDLRNRIIRAGKKQGFYSEYEPDTMPGYIGMAMGQGGPSGWENLPSEFVPDGPRMKGGKSEPITGYDPGRMQGNHPSRMRGGGLVRGYFRGGAMAPGGIGEILSQQEIVETPGGVSIGGEAAVNPEMAATMGPGMKMGAMQRQELKQGGDIRDEVMDAVMSKLIADQSGEPLSELENDAMDEVIDKFVRENGPEALGEIVVEVASALGIPVGPEGAIAEETVSEEYVSPEGLMEESVSVIDEARGFRHGGSIMGPGDGMSDSISATIDGVEPIVVSNGETIIPADATAALGNGSTEAGAQRLMEMVDRIRMARTGTSGQPPAINPRDVMIA